MLSVSALLLISSAAFAGGAIGGGEINKYPLYSCEAAGIDPTFPSDITTVLVNGEADYDGFLMPNMSVTVELQDVNGNAVAYLPTLTLPNNFNPKRLVAHQWAQTLQGKANPVTAIIQVNGFSGSFKPVELNSIGELQLSNCEYIATAQ